MKRIVLLMCLLAACGGDDSDEDCWIENVGGTAYNACCELRDEEGVCLAKYYDGPVGGSKPYCYIESDGQKRCYENPK